MADLRERCRQGLIEDINWTGKMVDMYKDPTMMAWHLAFSDTYDQWFKDFSYRDSLAVRWQLKYGVAMKHIDFERYYDACQTLERLHGKVVGGE